MLTLYWYVTIRGQLSIGLVQNLIFLCSYLQFHIILVVFAGNTAVKMLMKGCNHASSLFFATYLSILWSPTEILTTLKPQLPPSGNLICVFSPKFAMVFLLRQVCVNTGVIIWAFCTYYRGISTLFHGYFTELLPNYRGISAQ